MFLLFYGAMSGQGANPEAGAWFVEAQPVIVLPRARRSSRARFEAEREKSTSVVIVSSLFLVLIAATVLVGGHAAIDPLLRSAMESREAKGVGDVFYTMPDGILCRHMSFDNATGEASEGALEPCAEDIARHVRPKQGFAWSAQ
jgi:hypothetical protein